VTAAEHARRASELLELVERQQERIHELTEMERIQLTLSHPDLQWTRDLAVAHALTATALVAVSPYREPDSPRDPGKPTRY
jgi:hypothetical protein